MIDRDQEGKFVKGSNVGHKPYGGFNTRFEKGHKDLVPKEKRGHNEETRKKISRGSIGKHCKENCHFWKGGISKHYKEEYYSLKYRLWREAVFQRDLYICQGCGFKGNNGYITAHHIKSWAKYPDLRFNIDNGMTLCEDCHKMTDNYKGRGKKSEQ